MLLISIILTLMGLCVAVILEDVAMKQPGIDIAKSHLDDISFMVALQPSTSATPEDIKNAVSVLISNFGKDANETGYDGKLQIGLTDRPGRIKYVLDVSAKDAISHVNDTQWLNQIQETGQVFNDDTRNYDPYGNRYTSIPDGKGLLGSMVFPWLGYKKYGNVWYDPSDLPTSK